ncbi:MAG: NUMOD4 domain-containing protein [Nitrospirota bacterium]|nr:NUMOD4 domain-containing protein [Nitrospirota bacterium]
MKTRQCSAEHAHEIWRPVTGWEGIYEVSDLGRVKSVPRWIVNTLGVRRRVGGNILRSFEAGSGGFGVHMVATTLERPQQYAGLGQLVLRAFVGPPPTEDSGAFHLNGNQSDNRLENLYWKRRPLINSCRSRGQGHGCSKLTEDKVKMIRTFVPTRPGELADLAKRLGIHPGTLYNIRYGRNWGHVT